mmetsp:Transcript_72725/g.194038  ORF Transcript_72725/g.194038 Transcript_72725/m.194038 type:complete len:323 (-) Transcript_72725:3917-4885(-)
MSLTPSPCCWPPPPQGKHCRGAVAAKRGGKDTSSRVTAADARGVGTAMARWPPLRLAHWWRPRLFRHLRKTAQSRSNVTGSGTLHKLGVAFGARALIPGHRQQRRCHPSAMLGPDRAATRVRPRLYARSRRCVRARDLGSVCRGRCRCSVFRVELPGLHHVMQHNLLAELVDVVGHLLLHLLVQRNSNSEALKRAMQAGPSADRGCVGCQYQQVFNLLLKHLGFVGRGRDPVDDAAAVKHVGVLAHGGAVPVEELARPVLIHDAAEMIDRTELGLAPPQSGYRFHEPRAAVPLLHQLQCPPALRVRAGRGHEIRGACLRGNR